MQSCLFVGIDTHKSSHTAAVLSDYFDTEATITFDNSYQGFCVFLEKLKTIAEGKSFLFGLEDSQGLGNYLAEFLIEKGYLVLDVNPVYTDRGRKHTIHRDKSDNKDACLIAKTLIREKNNLHQVRINRNSLALRELVRHRQILVEESTKLKNRLHGLLFNQYGQTLSIFSSLFNKVALAFFARYPNPSMLGSISPYSLTDFLKANSKGRYGEKKARAILSSPNISMTDNLTDTRSYIIRKHVERLVQIAEELTQIRELLSTLVEKSSYGSLTSIPGVDVITAAKIISSVTDIGRFSSSAKLAKFAGIAPREKSSGKKQIFQKSKHGKKYLRSTIYFMALAHISKTRNGRDKNPISRAYYLKKIAEGKTKKEAITCLCRRLIDLIFAVMRDRSIYNFSKSEFTKQHNVILNTIVA